MLKAEYWIFLWTVPGTHWKIQHQNPDFEIVGSATETELGDQHGV
jgi:hypothetical protein